LSPMGTRRRKNCLRSSPMGPTIACYPVASGENSRSAQALCDTKQRKEFQSMASDFATELHQYVTEQLLKLDLLKDETPAVAAGQPEIVRRLKIAMKNELEASELAALWMPTTPEIDVKLGLARQSGDEAKHYRL